ncbi:hypothetical protein ACEPPN_013200 [Leptodophora sp. 'Broadleaf-Isolate-01']
MPPDAWRLAKIRFKKRELSQLQAIWEHEAWDDGELDWGSHGPLKREGKGEEDAAAAWGGEGDDSGGVEEEKEEEEEEEGFRETETRGVLNSPAGQLLELLFQLSMASSMAQFIDAQPSSSLLVYFSGVLGFSPDAQDFLPAKKYTPCLSGLIYVQRLLFLEYALPLRAYPYLGIPRRSRLQQYEGFDGVRLRYMVTGSQSPLEEFQSLRFLDMLQRERDSCYKEVVPSRLLFRSGRDLDRPWDSARLTAILRKATTVVWGRPVNSQLYRQLTIGITEKHVQEVHKPFNRFDDVGARADQNVVFAWQSGHRPLQRGTTYGLNGAFPNQLQPALLRAYEWASTR